MAKNIVILLDGTSNQISGDRTNVLRLYGSLERSRQQLVFYQPGVGTFGLSGWWQQIKSRFLIVLGLATGAGIAGNMMDAYRFLVDHHAHGDRIFIIGFSRGAYTARLLAGFIRIFGLVRPEQAQLVRYAWRAYARLGQPGSKNFSTEIEHFQKVLRGAKVRIEFLGLWDTVASVFDSKAGFPWLTTKQKAYTNKNDRVRAVRHAVAIDEQRTYFQPSLWEPGQRFEFWSEEKDDFDTVPQDFEEVWFSGCHGDVGGGHADQQSGLAKIAFAWLYREAVHQGVRGKDKVFARLIGEDGTGDYGRANPLADINQSMNRGWALVELSPRKIPKTAFYNRLRLGSFYIPMFDRRRIPEGAKLHEAVIERLENHPAYTPPNLPGSYEVARTRPA